MVFQAPTVDGDNPLWQLFEAVRTVAGSHGALLSDPFWRLPSRKLYPDYYKEIKNPVALMQIRRKLLRSAYGTVSEVAGDMTIMFENAKKYNIPTSKLYKVSIFHSFIILDVRTVRLLFQDAVRLQKVMQDKVEELLDIDQVKQRMTYKVQKVCYSTAFIPIFYQCMVMQWMQ